MTRWRLYLYILILLLTASCTSKGTIDQLQGDDIVLEDIKIEGNLDLALLSYSLQPDNIPNSGMDPDILLSFADMKIAVEFDFSPIQPINDSDSQEDLFKSEENSGSSNNIAKSPSLSAQTSGVQEAVALYKELLTEFPKYERNDRSLYQLARIYEEIGYVRESIKIMGSLIKAYPKSHFIEEAHFRRGEFYFSRKKFELSAKAYQAIVDLGKRSIYYEYSLYKLGWSQYKLERYKQAIHQFVALLDYRDVKGYDWRNPNAHVSEKRTKDTFRVISLSFSYIGGTDTVSNYFNKYGRRIYEAAIYRDFGDFLLEKRRFGDAAKVYGGFAKKNPCHRLSPIFARLAIKSFREGGFSKSLIRNEEIFLAGFGLKSAYWTCFDYELDFYEEVKGYVEASLREVASYYHARFQDKQYKKEKELNFKKAVNLYQQYIDSFSNEDKIPEIHFKYAELLLENKQYLQSAAEFGHIAYGYTAHPRSAEAGYNLIYSLRKNLVNVDSSRRDDLRREVVSNSLKFAEAFRGSEKSTLVMSSAVEDLYEMKDYALAARTAKSMLVRHVASQDLRRSIWLIFANASFELGNFQDAEEGYLTAKRLTKKNDTSRADTVENLAITLYKKAEEFNKTGEYRRAVTYFLLVGKEAATATIRPVADFDGATVLMKLKRFKEAERVLVRLRSNFPKHELQPEVTKKLAFIYKTKGNKLLAANEYERIGKESSDLAVRREAWKLAIDYYIQTNQVDKLYPIYRRYVSNYKEPLGYVIEIRQKIAEKSKLSRDMGSYYSELKKIVEVDANGGSKRTDRTRYLASLAAMELAQLSINQFTDIKLNKPFADNLQKKKEAMTEMKGQLDQLFEYGVDEVTAAATYYLAEMYYDFSNSLIDSERPGNLSVMEREQYDLSIEEQAFPFEEKAIQVHEKNLELMKSGIYNQWVGNSIDKLAKLVPARYLKVEESIGLIKDINMVDFEEIINPSK
ncbi:MAG: tetratricopeptide repeat protein [Gallionella sp.]